MEMDMSNLKCTLAVIQSELNNLSSHDDYANWVDCYGQLLIDWVQSAISDSDTARQDANNAIAAASKIICSGCEKHDITDAYEIARLEIGRAHV